MKRHTLAATLALIAAPALADSDPQPPAMFLTAEPAADTCHAGALAYLIGVPAENVDGLEQMGRVSSPHSIGTTDYLPSRRNIGVDENGIITGVTCG